MTRLAVVQDNVVDGAPAGGDEPGPGLGRGEQAALDACYRQHAPALLALAFRLTGSREDAEDIVHDVFVGLPEALRKYEERGQFTSWLKRIAARTALMHQRRAQNRRETPRDVASVQSRLSADGGADRDSDRARIAGALRMLTPALREVFMLKVIEGMPHADIGRLLGISTGTSEVRLTRAVAKLRILLGGHR